MEMRAITVKQILAYRRYSFHFPKSVEMQFALLLKFYKYNIQRHLFPITLTKYELNHFSGVFMIETLYSKHLTASGNDFADSEGWTFGPKKCCCRKCSKTFTYLFDDRDLNNIHFNEQ